MFVVGLTGGIASGKTTVTNILKELGAKVIDADLIAREVVQPDQPVWKELVNYFGEDILLSNREIDRKKLGEIVFHDSEQLEKINQITHPVIVATIGERIKQLKRDESKGVLLVDVPLLIELNMISMVDEVWLVYVDRDLQKIRLQNRDQLSPEQADARLNSQMPLVEKRSFATRIIDNSGSLEDTKDQIVEIWREIANN